MQRNSLTAILLVLAAGLLWGTVGPAEILARPAAGPVAVGGARILSGGLVLAVIMLVRDPGAFRALPEHLSLPIAAGTLLLLGGLILVWVSWSPRRRQASNARRLPRTASTRS
jgi:drug/metabolite transporter (DMT)-like permease